MKFSQRLEVGIASLELWLQDSARPVWEAVGWCMKHYIAHFPLAPLLARFPVIFVPFLLQPVLDPVLGGLTSKNVLHAGRGLLSGLLWFFVVSNVHPALAQQFGLRWLYSLGNSTLALVLYGILRLSLFFEPTRGRVLNAWFNMTTVGIYAWDVLGVELQDIYFENLDWIATNQEELVMLTRNIAFGALKSMALHVFVCALLKIFVYPGGQWFYFKICLIQWPFPIYSEIRRVLPDLRPALSYRWDTATVVADEYTYTALPRDGKTIRLLLLHPRHPRGLIRGSLIEVPLDNSPCFLASSYTWGPSTPTFPVLVDGRTLRVTANAHTLLRDMSSYLLPRLLWIDSICINQKDEAEKSAQVQLMQAIYHRASIVTIWLSHEGAGHAYGTAVRFKASLDACTALFLTRMLSTLEVMPRTEAELMGLMNTWRTYPQWPSLITLVSNPWFQRIWVVQEAVIARNVRVVYSGVEIDWKTFAKGLLTTLKPPIANVINMTKLEQETQQPTLEAIMSLQSIFLYKKARESGETISFGDVIFSLRHFRATDPRDYVYGIQALCEESDKDWTTPDYSYDLGTVFFRAALRLIDEGQMGRTLARAGVGLFERPEPALEGWPSWIPDWSQLTWGLPLITSSDAVPYAAGGNLADQNRHSRQGRSLFLSTCVLGTIAELSEIWEPEEDLRKVQGGMSRRIMNRQTLILESEHTRDPYPFTSPPRPLHEACWRLFIGDRTGETRPAPDSMGVSYLVYLNMAKTLDEAMAGSINRHMTDQETQDHHHIASYGVLHIQASLGRRAGVMNEGYLGLFPPFSLPQDIVCVVEGVSVPLVFRSVSGTQKFILVGECFVLGFMDGEGFLSPDKREVFEVI